MVKLEIDVDPSLLFLKPQHVMQTFSLHVLQKRQELLEGMKGLEWKNSTASGRVHDCTSTAVVVLLPDGTKQELPLTKARLSQLCAAATTRK